jgi:hypothetical protein
VSAVTTLGSPPRATRTLGAILVDSGQLTTEEAERVLAYQRTHNLRFGEAAIRLGLITEPEVQFALSRQFAYAYLRKVPGETRALSDESSPPTSRSAPASSSCGRSAAS